MVVGRDLSRRRARRPRHADVWGRYERAIVTSGLSKAYGLPGCASAGSSRRRRSSPTLWGVHDYTTIAPGALSDRLARIALAPARRQTLLARTRGIVRTNYPLVAALDRARTAACRTSPPDAGAIVFVRYQHADQLDRADRAAPRRAERAGRARRSLRHGRLPAHRLRIAIRRPVGGAELIGELLDSLPIAAASDAR